MCSGCGQWWVVDEHEYPAYEGASRRYARIPCCPQCEQR